MELIEHPRTLAERIVNAVCADIYGRSGGDYFFDGIDADVREEELIPQLVATVELVLRADQTGSE
jgi:hypothetical protein